MGTLAEYYGAGFVAPLKKAIEERGGIVIYHIKVDTSTGGVEFSDYNTQVLPQARRTSQTGVEWNATLVTALGSETTVVETPDVATRERAQQRLAAEGWQTPETGLPQFVVGVRRQVTEVSSK